MIAVTSPSPRETLNDVHSRLNATTVAEVVPVRTVEEVARAVHRSRRSGASLSIAGGRHAMGGQQFGAGTIHLDTRGLSRIVELERERGIVEVEAGIQWPELVHGLRALQERVVPAEQWAIVQKQTGADRLAIGGALSANAHGRGLALAPISADVESFTLVDASGEPRHCSREENGDLFALALGGYGLFGVICSVRLRLRRRALLERVVTLESADRAVDELERRARDGYLYGDFQFETDEASPTFLTRGVLAAYRPVRPTKATPTTNLELSGEDWMRLLHLAHADKTRAFEDYSTHYLATSGQLYWSDTSQLVFYPDGYHAALDRILGGRFPGSEMISELYVPRDELAGFLRGGAARLRALEANVIYGTVRLTERDRDTFLAWAREPWACIVLNLHVDHCRAGIAKATRAFRALIDLAAERGGSYFLTYHRWATAAQVVRCHPNFRQWLRAKCRLDPDSRFESEWYRHHRRLLDA